MKKPKHYNFNQLSLPQLLAAREQAHANLMVKKNVVATAVGRYLIRLSDIDEHGHHHARPKDGKSEVRRLDESVVLADSWPCIIVFVKKWEQPSDLANGSDLVPKILEFNENLFVPTCVVLAPDAKPSDDLIAPTTLNFPTNKMGGGFPVTVMSQHQQHVATAGCIVTDGHSYYMLTGRHVAGGEGQEISSQMGNDPLVIGHTVGSGLAKVPFNQLYPGWHDKFVEVNCDAGLVYLENINLWKTDVLGVGTMGPIYDLNGYSMNLGLIAEHQVRHGEIENSATGNVRAFGAVSGAMTGEILAMFYRYQAVGGKEYVSDFLISGRNGELLNTHPGDSGALWFLEDEDDEGKTIFCPLGLHWGQHQFVGNKNKSKYPFALASNLTNICRELDVQLVRDWELDNPYTWGKRGHYGVGYQAVECLAPGKLKDFMEANEDRISFAKADINPHMDDKDNPVLGTDPTSGFCPLADVPDLIWKQPKYNAGTGKGKPWGRQGDENPNHFADADAKDQAGKTLFDYCPNVASLKVANWIAYYDATDAAFAAAGLPVNDKNKRGLISFRVWQIFDDMVEAAKANDPVRFLLGAGVIAHYVGDGCQPLHGSYMADGDPADNQTISYTPPRGGTRHPAGVPYDKIVNPGQGVHAGYEDNMVDAYIQQILDGLPAVVAKQQGQQIPRMTNGQEAGFAVLDLIEKTQQVLAPKTLVEAYKQLKASNGNISEGLYDQFGDQTIDIIARGSRYLAALWQGAWDAGQADFAANPVEKEKLQALYANPEVLPSYHLDTIETHLTTH